MRRAALYGIGWVAAATVAVLLAWQGVGLVGRNVTDAHPRALTADQAREALAAGGTGPSAVPDTSPSTTSGPRTTATTAPRPATSSPSASPTTAPSAPPAPPTTSTGVVRTYNLVGGSAALRFQPGKVTVVWANPNPGFRVDIDPRDDGGVRVRFDGGSGRSQIEAWWDGGPQDRVENGGSGGGGGRGGGGSGPG